MKKQITLYKNIVNKITKEFCKKHEFDFYEEDWVGGSVGEVIGIGGYFFNFTDILYDMETDQPRGEIFKWYDYSLEVYYIPGLKACNYEHWCKGAPRYSKEELEASATKAEETKNNLLDHLHDYNINFS